MKPPEPMNIPSQLNPQAQESTSFSMPESGETSGSGISPLLSSTLSKTSSHSATSKQPFGGSNAVAFMEVEISSHSHRSNRGEVRREVMYTSEEVKQDSTRNFQSSKSHSDQSHHSTKSN